MGPKNLYCNKWRKISKSHCDLDLGPTMPNIELVRVIFIYTTMYLNFIFLNKCRGLEPERIQTTNEQKNQIYMSKYIWPDSSLS